MSLMQQQIDAAVTWWVNDIRGPRYKATTADQDRKNPEQAGTMALAGMMASLSCKAVSDEQVGRFEGALRDYLAGEGERCSLYSDYGPASVGLNLAVDAAGLSPNAISWKTCMWFACGGVQVRHGYGAEIEELILPYPPQGFCACGHLVEAHDYSRERVEGRTHHWPCRFCDCQDYQDKPTTRRVPTPAEWAQHQAIRADHLERRRLGIDA